ncbi:MAG: glycoside hydrolase family 3 N-terminal domain-containing protein, partial [Ktedonobacteraceae bacterium]
MTIQNQQPQQPFTPPPDASLARPMPAKVYQQQRAEPVEELPVSAQPYKRQAPLVPAPNAPRRKRRVRTPVIALLLVLIGLVGVGSFFAPRFFQTSSGAGTKNIQGVTPGGPFVGPPLSSKQVDAIMHLSGYMKDKALASMYVSHMTLDEELGQLIMVEYADGCGSASGVCPGVTSYYESDLDTMINTLHAGGVIMYEFQMQNFNQTKNDLAKMQSRASIPLLISADEEGGPYVHRLSHIDGYRMSATDIANSGSTDVAAQQGAKTAHDLLALGINEDLAPDVDVNLVNGYDMVTRTFGNTPDSVIKYASAYIKAMQGAGVVGCIKHFPG